jgi:hypothetical protein
MTSSWPESTKRKSMLKFGSESWTFSRARNVSIYAFG